MVKFQWSILNCRPHDISTNTMCYLHIRSTRAGRQVGDPNTFKWMFIILSSQDAEWSSGILFIKGFFVIVIYAETYCPPIALLTCLTIDILVVVSLVIDTSFPHKPYYTFLILPCYVRKKIKILVVNKCWNYNCETIKLIMLHFYRRILVSARIIQVQRRLKEMPKI
jgi:hypothetical protein